MFNFFAVTLFGQNDFVKNPGFSFVCLMAVLSTVLLFVQLYSQSIVAHNWIKYRLHLENTTTQSQLVAKNCSPCNHIMFLKIRKCASSTIQNIFLRYGYKRNLTFAFGDELNYIGNPDLFQDFINTPKHDTRYGRNQILFGMGPDSDASLHDVQNLIKLVESNFDLVMIAERLDESLVLLRKIMCWDWNDVLVFTKNARRNDYKVSLTPDVKQVLRDLNNADIQIYKYFLKKHRKLVQDFGVDRMEKEVNELRDRRRDSYGKCVSQTVDGYDSSARHKEYFQMVNNYVLKNKSDSFCLHLTYPELTFIKVIKEKQTKEITPSCKN